MHISEGILPLEWAVATTAPSLPIVLHGARQIQKQAEAHASARQLLALVGAAVFVISALAVPVPISGTSAHPTGIGLAAILVGPAPAVAVTGVALFLQALFMAHGGLTTWGANVLAMGILGSYTAYAAFRVATALRLPFWVAAAAAGVLGDLVTYAGTSCIMGLALHGDRAAFEVVMVIFAAFLPSVIPLAVLDGVLTVGVLRYMLRRRPDLSLSVGSLPAGQPEVSHAR